MPLHDIDAILDRIDLEALADELCGTRRGRGSGARWPSPVPAHPQTGKTPPMSIFTDRRGRQRFTCWSTGTSGTAIDLVSVNRRLDISASIQWLADRAGSVAEPIRRPPPPERPKRTGASGALRDYVHACRAELYKPSGKGALQWLERRCLDPAVLELNDVGFDPGPSDLRRARGLPYRGPGIVLPTFDRHGQLVYAQTRYFDPDNVGRKYDNPSTMHAVKPVLSRPRLLNANGHHTLVCEGVIDALTVASVGEKAVAVLSAGTSGEAVAELSGIKTGLVIALDPDLAGRHGSQIMEQELLTSTNRAAPVLSLRGGDLNDHAQTHGADFSRVLATWIRQSSPRPHGRTHSARTL